MSTTWLSDKALVKSPSRNPQKIEILIKIKLIRNLIFRIIFLKMVISRIKHLYVCLDVRVNIIIVFFDFRFPSRKSQGQKKIRFTNFNSLDIENIMLPQHRQKPFWLFKANIFLSCVRKNICTAPFLDAHMLHYWSTLKVNVCIFLYISLTTFLFQNLSKVYLMKDGMGRNWIISLRRLAVWALQNVLQFFILIEVFKNLFIFLAFQYF